MQSTFEFDVFLSYSSKDRDAVAALADRLQQRGFKVWLDTLAIRGGDDIILAIEQGLESSQILVLCMSKHSMTSDWVLLERNTTLFRDPANRHRRFIPLLLENCRLPDTLRRFNYIDWRQRDDDAFEKLVAALGPPGSAPHGQASPSLPAPKQQQSPASQPTTTRQPLPTSRPIERHKLLWLALPILGLFLAWIFLRSTWAPVDQPQQTSAREALEDGSAAATVERPTGGPGASLERSSEALNNLPVDGTTIPDRTELEAPIGVNSAPGSGDTPDKPMIRTLLDVPAGYQKPMRIEVGGILIRTYSKGGEGGVVIEIAIPTELFDQEGAFLTYHADNGLPPLETLLPRPREGEELRIKLTEADQRPAAEHAVLAQDRPAAENTNDTPETDPEVDIADDTPSAPYRDDTYYVPSELQKAYANDSGAGGNNYLHVVPQAAYRGNHGLEVVVLEGSSNSVFTALNDNRMLGEKFLFLELAFNADALTIGSDSNLVFLAVFDHKESYAESIPILGVRLSEHLGKKWLFLDAFNTDGELVSDDGTLISDGWNELFLEWQSGNGDGYLGLWLKNPKTRDLKTSSIVGLQTELFNLDELRLGGLQVLGSNLEGILHLDDPRITRTRSEIDGEELPPIVATVPAPKDPR